jgi:hypothetical protein
MTGCKSPGVLCDHPLGQTENDFSAPFTECRCDLLPKGWGG